ncbi:MAG: AAA family ATPase [Actinomycetes bacterium]
MRIAIAGKGGSGKTTTTATLARLAARAGHRVVCIDADSNPNLAVALGAGGPDAAPVLPAGLVSRRLDADTALTLPIAEVLATHAIACPDGVVLTSMGRPGHAEEGCLCSAHGVVRATLADLDDPGTLTLLDLEASPEHFSRGTARHVDVLLLVTEPYFRSLETARRMAELAAELPIPNVVVLGTKARDAQDVGLLEEFCERHALPLVGVVPFDLAVLDADRDRRPLIEEAPDGAVVAAYARVLEQLVEPAPAT